MSQRYLYLHGFQSGPQSLKARETAAWLQQHPAAGQLLCPQLSPYPAQAMQQLQLLIAQQQPTALIGSSLGGFYATALAEQHRLPAVLINPAIWPERELQHFLGPLHNPYTGEDYRLSRQHMAELAAMRPPRLTPARYYLLLGTADAVLDWREAVRHYAGARQLVRNGDDHRLQAWPQLLPGVVRFVDDYYRRQASDAG